MYVSVHFSLYTQKCLTSRVLMKHLWASKSEKQIDDAFSIYAITQKEGMHPLKATGSAFLHCKGRCAFKGGGSLSVSTKMAHRGSGQLFKCLCCLWSRRPPVSHVFFFPFSVFSGFLSLLGFVWVWQVLGSKCTTQMCLFKKKTLCWEKSA